MRLVFVRHGEPDYANDCLTENGKLQAEAAARRLEKENISEIFSSPMGRAVETASYTAELIGKNISILDFMHEINWGNDSSSDADELDYNGHPWTLSHDLLTGSPEFVSSDDWDKHHFFKDNICLGYYRTVSEKFDGFLERFGLYRQDGLYLCRECHDETIALFAHGGSGAVMFSHVLNLPFPFVLTSLPYGVCSVSVLNFGTEKGKKIIPRLEIFNDMGHIAVHRTEKLFFEK